jgi:hypothetical protein
MSRKRAKRFPVPVSKIVRSLVKDLGVEETIKRHEIWFSWKEIVGKEISAHTAPAFFAGNCLFITVDHSTWMHQLNFVKDQILQNINRNLKTASVSEIRFRLGTLPVEKHEVTAAKQAPTSISKAEMEEIEGAIGSIASPELREALRRLICRDLTATRSRPEPAQ